MKIGLFGGTFDPIHNGHLWIAKNAYETYSLDKVLFIPSGISYMKSGVLSVSHRVNMVKLAISDYPFFSLSTIESDKNQNSYSYETILELKKENPNDEFFFIIGFDSLKNMVKWKNPEIIFKEVTVLVAIRDDGNIDLIKEYIDEYSKEYGACIKIIQCEKIEVSSTQIRQDIINGNDVSKMLPSKVYNYIIDNRLYKEMANERQ